MPAAEPQTEAAVTPEGEPEAAEAEPPAEPKPKRRVRKRPVEPPDAWKKNIPMFGGSF
jgi:hypothetical protein